MNIVFAVFVGWTMLLMDLKFGQASSILYDRLNETGLTGGEKRQMELPSREFILGALILRATGLNKTDVYGIKQYGCWCGQRGAGETVDNFDYCCKVHDFCENDAIFDYDKCAFTLNRLNVTFEFDPAGNTCTLADQYRTTNNAGEQKCGYSLCLCDMELVRCIAYNENDFNVDKIGWNTSKCAITAPSTGHPKADVVILIQDSQGISTTTVAGIKTVVRRLLTLLGSNDTDYNFALAIYATSQRMSCFGNATETISYMNREYRHGRTGHKNLFKNALSRMVLKQFNASRDDRKPGDTAKILVIFSDGRAERGNGDVMDTFRLEETARLLRVNSNIKMVGALIPNTQNTQRIQELKGIVSSPDDALNADRHFSASSDLDRIAHSLALRVRRFI